MAEIGIALAKALATGLLRRMGSVCVGQIFKNIFPSGKPDYFDEVYEEISKIVKSAISQSKINKTNAEINALKTWVKNDYLPRKDANASKEELFNMIKDGEYDLAVHMVSQLQSSETAEPGLGVFLIAAGVHLHLLQELAVMDPHTKNPADSSYAKSLKRYAEDYAEHVNSTYDSIEKKRIAAITSEVAYKFHTPAQVGLYCPITHTTEWKDECTNKTFKDRTVCTPKLSGETWDNGTKDELKKRSKQDRLDYIKQAKKKLARDLHYPKNVADLWLGGSGNIHSI